MTKKSFKVSCYFCAFCTFWVVCVCMRVLKAVLCSISVAVFSIMASLVQTFGMSGISPASSLTVREVKGWNGMLLCIFSSTVKHFNLECLGIMGEKIWNLISDTQVQMHRYSSEVFIIYRKHRCVEVFSLLSENKLFITYIFIVIHTV